jgi:DNA gyrase subunit B
MNAEQLWDTTMDPNTRTLNQINVEDAEEADRLFRILMGEDVQARKHFILTHAKTVKDLDI